MKKLDGNIENRHNIHIFTNYRQVFMGIRVS